MKKKVGLIGYGTIGKYIFQKLSGDEAEFSFVYDEKVFKDTKVADIITDSISNVEKKCKEGLDLVIEAATSQAVVDLAPIVLKHSSMVAFSTCAFADEEFQSKIRQLCHGHNHNLYIPHGAILGLDGIWDGKTVLKEVSITTIKKPENLGRSDSVRTVVYEGPTRGACRAYPRNVNVHAGIALAGLGFDDTHSRIVADPESMGNVHIIEVKAEGCNFRIEVSSDPISGVTGAYIESPESFNTCGSKSKTRYVDFAAFFRAAQRRLASKESRFLVAAGIGL